MSGFGGVGGSNSVQFIDLVSVTYSAGIVSESYSSSTSSSGVLTVTSGGTTVAKINLVGSGYTTASFQLNAGSGGGGTIITDPSVDQQFGGLAADICFSCSEASLAYAQSKSHFGSTVEVAGSDRAGAILLLGNYIAASFVSSAYNHGVMLLAEAPHLTNEHALLTQPNHKE